MKALGLGVPLCPLCLGERVRVREKAEILEQA